MNTLPLYRTAFPDFGEMDVAIPEGFEDVSYRNDVCPSFLQRLPNKLELQLFVDYKDPAQRELEGSPRFFVLCYDSTGDFIVVASGNDLDAVMAKVTQWVAR